jgi:hypothetical protein
MNTEQITIDNNLEYSRIGQLYSNLDRKYNFGLDGVFSSDKQWQRYQADLGVYTLILNSISSSENNLSQEITRFVKSISDSDLDRILNDFRNKNEFELYRYFSADDLKVKREIRIRLISKFLLENNL